MSRTKYRPLPPEQGRLRLVVNPYAQSGKLIDAYDDVMSMVEPTDWVCFMDGDAAFLEMADFGHVLQAYIDRYPETGIFTCYASRCHYSPQRRKGVDMASNDITYIAKEAVRARQDLHLQVKNMNRRIAGHLVMIQKRKYDQARELLGALAANKKVLGFDTKLSQAILRYGYDIRVMRGILIFHYLRHLTGQNNKIK